jgi:hypothetical protein
MTYATDRPPGQWDRKEHETGFTAILARLLEASPGAIGAVLVDAEGEAVDYAGDRIDPYDLKVAAATWRIVLQDIERGPLTERGGAPRRLVVRTTKRSFVLEALPEGYALLSILHRTAAFGHADRALDAALRDLYREAGWAAPPGLFRWHEVEVDVERARPTRIRVHKQWVPVHVIGKVAAGLQRGEVGYRVGFERSASELTLVLGRDERWYADAAPDALG